MPFWIIRHPPVNIFRYRRLYCFTNVNASAPFSSNRAAVCSSLTIKLLTLFMASSTLPSTVMPGPAIIVESNLSNFSEAGFPSSCSMPPFTMFVMGLSEWAGTHIYLIVAVFAALFAGYKAYYRTEAGRKNIDAIKRKLPLFGQLVVKSNCSRFVRTASTLLAAGVPMVDCLDIVSRIVTNVHYAIAIQNAREEVMKGIPLSEPLRDAADGIRYDRYW